MKKLILHIGTEKTGTSTIQKFLGLNRAELLHQGFRVPISTRENNFGENQRWFPALFYPIEFSDDFITNEFGDNANLRRKRILNKLEEFKNEIVKTNAKNYIISSEHLSSRLKDVNSITTLKEVMLDLFDDIEILLYIRNPINHAISQISTEAKSGRDIISQYKNGGEINNYIGDAILAIFGLNETRQQTLRATNGALEMINRMDEFKKYLIKAYGSDFDIRIGIHYGEVIVGSVGYGEDKKLTVIGDAVNIASRIEAINKDAGTRLLVSDDAYNEIRDNVDVQNFLRL